MIPGLLPLSPSMPTPTLKSLRHLPAARSTIYGAAAVLSHRRRSGPRRLSSLVAVGRDGELGRADGVQRLDRQAGGGTNQPGSAFLNGSRWIAQPHRPPPSHPPLRRTWKHGQTHGFCRPKVGCSRPRLHGRSRTDRTTTKTADRWRNAAARCFRRYRRW